MLQYVVEEVHQSMGERVEGAEPSLAGEEGLMTGTQVSLDVLQIVGELEEDAVAEKEIGLLRSEIAGHEVAVSED